MIRAGERRSLLAPGCLGVAALLWGWLADVMGMGLVLGGAMALVMEARHASRRRLVLTPRDLALGMDLCLLAIAASLVALFFTPRTESVGRLLLLWSPLLLFPLGALHVWSDAGSVPVRQLFHAVGQGRRAAREGRGPRVDPGLVWLAVCLAAAGAANDRGPWFFLGGAAILGLLLRGSRPRRHGVGRFLLVFVLAALAGWAGQWGLERVQEHVRGWARHRISDPYRAATAFGDVERIKFSHRILLRVAVPPERARRPLLLLESAYDFFARDSWQATDAAFAPLEADPDHPGEAKAGAPAFRLPGAGEAAIADEADWARVYQYFPRVQGMLALPLDAVALRGATAERLTGNRLGAVKAENVPGLIAYQATRRAGTDRLRPPAPLDTLVPPPERPSLERTIARLGLSGTAGQAPLPLDEILGRLLQAFHTDYAYTLEPVRRRRDQRPLEEFLETRRTGHCEYFASAATLLLRQLGHPARYAVGFSAQEWDAADGRFLVRDNHAHAWVLVWREGRWQEFDPTPPDWQTREAAGAPGWQAWRDWISRRTFAVARWRWLSQDRGMRRGLLLLAAGLGGFLILRLARRGGLRAAGDAEAGPGAAETATPFDLVRRQLEAAHGPRPPGECPRDWLRRLGEAELLPLLRLHQQARFDPLGLPEAEARRLDEAARAWLATRDKSLPTGSA